MAERVSFIPETKEESDDEFSFEGSSSKKKAKKSAEKLGAALIEKSEPPKTDNSLEKLRGLFAEKPEKTAEKSKAEATLQEASDEAIRNPISLEWRDLQPNELSGGEVVIELHPAEEGDMPPTDETGTVEMGTEHETPIQEEGNDPVPPTTSQGGGGSRGSGSGRLGNGTASWSGGTSGGSGSGGTPPRPPITSSSYPQPSRHQSVPTPNRGIGATPPSGMNFNQMLAAQQAADEAWSEGRGRGRREGLLAGLLVGGSIEHFRHKSREKKVEKKAKAEKLKQEKTQETTAMHINQLETSHEESIRKITRERLEYEQKLSADAEATITAHTSEAAATAKALAAEKARADSEKEKAELIERLNAQAAEQERLEAEALLKDPEHRIETSAWHAMEVDKSGHVVEDGSIEYGHEYYSERAHETGPKAQIDAKAGSTAVAAILSGSSVQGSGSNPSSSSPSHAPVGRSSQPPHLPPLVGIDAPDATHSASQVSLVALLPWLIILIIIGVTIALLS